MEECACELTGRWGLRGPKVHFIESWLPHDLCIESGLVHFAHAAESRAAVATSEPIFSLIRFLPVLEFSPPIYRSIQTSELIILHFAKHWNQQPSEFSTAKRREESGHAITIFGEIL